MLASKFQKFTIFICGAIVLLISISVLLGWYLDLSSVFIPRAYWKPMQAYTAIACAFSALALICSYLFKFGVSQLVEKAVGFIVLAMISFSLLQSLAINVLGIDAVIFNQSNASNLNFGRMSLSSAIALLFISIGLLINVKPLNTQAFKIQYLATSQSRKKAVQYLSIATLILGFMGLILQWLAALDLTKSVDYTRMSFLSSICSMVLGFGLYQLADVMHIETTDSDAQDDSIKVDKLFHTAAFALTLVCTIAGIVGFSALADKTGKQLSSTLLQVTQDRLYFFNTAISTRSEIAIIAAKDPHIGFLLNNLNKNPNDTMALAQLKQLANNFAGSSFKAIGFQRLDGHFVPGLGQLSTQDSLVIHYIGRLKGALILDKGYLLRSKIPLYNNANNLVGYMVFEQTLKGLDLLRQKIQSLGASSNMLLCGKTLTTIQCFPQNFNDKTFELARSYQKQRMPISYALDLNQTGILKLQNYNGASAIAAYGPIGDTELGMVITQDTQEIYAPIWQQLIYTILFTVALIGLGVWLMRKRMLPIAQHIEQARALSELEKTRFMTAAEGGFESFFIFEVVRGARNEMMDFKCVYINKIASDLISRKPNEFVGELLFETFPMTRGPEYFGKYKQVIETGNAIIDEIIIEESTIKAHWIARQIVKLGDGIAITVRDVTEKKLAENALKEALRIQSAIIHSASYSIIATDVNGVIMTMNKAALRMLWYDEFDLIGKANLELLHDKDEMILRAQTLSIDLGKSIKPNFEVLIAKTAVNLLDESEWKYVRKDGSHFPVKLSTTQLLDNQGLICGYLAIAYDISVQKRADEYIRHIALHDVLTGLPNRALFDDRACVAIEYAKRNKQQVTIALLDLDHFKHVNDSLGHHIGDKLLQEVTARLTSSIRPTDTVARMGGDEFAFVLPNTNHPQGSIQVFNKIIQVLKPTINAANHKLHASASIGVCVYPTDGEDLATLLRNADTAMYKAKALGRNNFQIFNREMELEASKRLNLENELRQAVENQAFELHYQPQINLKNGEIIGVEALIRWQRVPGVYFSPMDFIPVAEESGLIVPIGEWVIKTACHDAGVLKSALGKPIRMAVNVSPRQFRHNNLLEHIEESLMISGVSSQDFEVEITENVLVEDIENSINVLNQLHKAGIKVALDDFGTGYSSLSYLRKFPVDFIKIDQSFVKNIMINADDAALAKVIINMAKSLGIMAVAEGVETAEQYEFLQSSGCDEAQGYYISKPITVDQLLIFCKPD